MILLPKKKIFWYQNCKNCKVLMPWPKSIWKKYLWFLPLCYSKWEHLMIRKFSIPNGLSELLIFTIFEKSKEEDSQCVEVAFLYWWTCVFTRCFWKIHIYYGKKGNGVTKLFTTTIESVVFKKKIKIVGESFTIGYTWYIKASCLYHLGDSRSF